MVEIFVMLLSLNDNDKRQLIQLNSRLLRRTSCNGATLLDVPDKKLEKDLAIFASNGHLALLFHKT